MAATGGKTLGGGKQLGGGSKTCFKCGKPGHWSRDCTAPREDWIPSTYKGPAAAGGKTPAPAGAAAAGAAGTAAVQAPLADSFWGASDPPGGADGGAAPAAAPAPSRRKPKRPKLTVEELTGKAGLAHVYATFADEMRKTCKGRGHEASDLKRLIDMYHGWHRRFFPYVGFEVFIETLERLGSTKPLRACVHALRSREVYGVRYDDLRDDDDAPAPGWAAAAAQRDLEREGDAAAQQQPQTAPPPPPPPRAPRTVSEEEEERMILEALEEDDDDDDEAALAAMGEEAYS